MNETPEIVSTAYVTTTTSAGEPFDNVSGHTRRVVVGQPQPFQVGQDVFDNMAEKLNKAVEDDPIHEEEDDMSDKRMVRVLIVDPDEAVPVEKSVLFDSKEKLTDLTDEELFFEVDLKVKLDEHNKMRGGIVDKEVKDRTEHLEAVRIRDLKMLVVTLAEF